MTDERDVRDDWRVPSVLLGGLSAERAELFGKPHIGAFYARKGDRHSQRVEDGASCVCCGRRATNAHHACPLGRAGQIAVGGKTLFSALVAVCGSGTAGCHNGFHGGSRYEIGWVWHSAESAREWWSGEMFARGIEPYSPELYAFGHYVIRDKARGIEWAVGGYPVQGAVRRV